MELAVAGRELERGLRFVQRVVELRLRGERPRQPVTGARRFGGERQRVAPAAFGLVEESGRPDRVGVGRQRLGVPRRRGLQRSGFALRFLELSNPQGGADEADARAQRHSAVFRGGCLAIGLERLAVPRLVEEQFGELELHLRVVDIRRRPWGCKRGSCEKSRRGARAGR